MAQGVRMKVTQQIVGNHDPRILLGSHETGGFSWGGGEEIVVTPELAANYEKSGIARRIEEQRESAMLKPAESVAAAPPKKREGGKTPAIAAIGLDLARNDDLVSGSKG